MKIRNTNVNGTNQVTLFGRFSDGTWLAEVMTESQVPHPRYWRNSEEEFVVHIAPTRKSLDTLVELLNSGQLSPAALKQLGSPYGGYSELGLQVGRPADLESGKRVNVYLDATSIARASKIGNGNVSEGIRIALNAA
jgi:hypothetical protein